MVRRHVLVLGVLCLVLSVTRSAPAGVQYTVTDLGALDVCSNAYGINNIGQVVGESYHYTTLINGRTYSSSAFLYTNGTMTNLGTLGGIDSTAYGINDSGQVVGVSDTSASYWTYGDNSRYYPVDGAFIYSNGNMTNLGASQALAINTAGQVVGMTTNNHAFLENNGTMTDLGTLVGSPSGAAGISGNGQIAGSFTAADGTTHAFLYCNGTISDLGPGSAKGVNNSGQVVGQSGVDAFLYSNGTMTDLNNLIDPASGWWLSQANAINDLGWIVGQGTNPLGQTHAFLLTPIPEPSTAALAASGLAAVLLAAWRRRKRSR